MKNSSIQLICSFSRHLGSVVQSIVEQSEINELLKKKVLEAIQNAPFDPSLAAQYPSPAGKPSKTGEKEKEESVAVSLSDLVEAFDATSDVNGMK